MEGPFRLGRPFSLVGALALFVLVALVHVVPGLFAEMSRNRRVP
jgi:hypothetical protein